MSYKLNSPNRSGIDDTTENSIIAKLRRLKIEENLLVNSINKINPMETEADDPERPIVYGLELKNYTAKLKNRFIEIKNMFGDLKAITMTDEKLSNADIENMKRDVVKLDDKIRFVKGYVHSELASAMSKEKELTKQMNDFEERQTKSTFKLKTRIKPFNQIVTSPVKVMIQSPFKCKEVQDFQEFMMSSPNRHGGWNEYHHNVFVQIWQKHFKCNEQINILNESQELTSLNHDQFRAFQMEMLEKLPGYMNDDIISHHKWYCKYLYLKELQQDALNKWKRNKGILSKSQYKQDICDNHHIKSVKASRLRDYNVTKALLIKENVEELLGAFETHTADEIANALCDLTLQENVSFDTAIDKSEDDKAADAVKQKQRPFSDVLKPTKQWISRCYSEREGGNQYNDLESIKKL